MARSPLKLSCWLLATAKPFCHRTAARHKPQPCWVLSRRVTASVADQPMRARVAGKTVLGHRTCWRARSPLQLPHSGRGSGVFVTTPSRRGPFVAREQRGLPCFSFFSCRRRREKKKGVGVREREKSLQEWRQLSRAGGVRSISEGKAWPALAGIPASLCSSRCEFVKLLALFLQYQLLEINLAR